MLKIDTEKLWKLLKKDKKIKKKLFQYIKEEEERFLEAQSIYEAGLSNIKKLEEKKGTISRKLKDVDDEITKKHGEISFIEFKKMFAELRLKRLLKIYRSCKGEEKKKRYEKLIQNVEQDLEQYNHEQESIMEEIEQFEVKKETLHEKERDIKKEISDAYDQASEDKKYMEWCQEKRDEKVDRFYKLAYEEVSENFKPCQDLVVPDLEAEKKMTKEEAKAKANPILIDEEYLLSSPEQLHVRRLTKDEKEEYRKIA